MIDRTDVEGGFLAGSERIPGRVFVLQGPWQTGYRRHFRGDVVGIRLSRSAGWNAEPLDFVETIDGLKSVEIYNWDVKHVSVLEGLAGLHHVGLECQFRKIDFSRLSKLFAFSVKWRPGCESVFDVEALEYLNVSGYPFEDLQPLSKLRRLKRLHIQSTRLQRLDGLESLPAFEELDLAYCPKLSDISGISSATRLRIIEVDSCKGVGDLSALEGHATLERLLIEVGSNGRIRSLAPLASCKALNELFLIGIVVENGDLSPLMSLPRLRKLAIAERRAYTPPVAEVKRSLGIA